MKLFSFLSLLWFASTLASSPEENQGTDDAELVQGDMKFLPGLTRGSVQRSLWPNGVVVYEIESSLSNQPKALSAIKSAMKEWTTKTQGCITFRKRQENEWSYVSFYNGGECSSYVGKSRYMQRLSLDVGCWRHGIVVHEIGHAIGFFHEQSRRDRDEYVEIKWESIIHGKEGNFFQSSNVNSLGTPYDYGSIMHYGARYFSKNGQPTIVPKQAEVTIGQREALSPIDVEQTRLLYGCSGTPSSSLPPTIPQPTPPFSAYFWCTFDKDMCGFKQYKWDYFDWTRNSGPTTSENTGPSGDHTSGKGYYMYIKALRHHKYESAKISRMVTLTGKSCLRFYYRMYGEHILNVELGNVVILKKSGDKGNRWHMVQVPLPGTGAKKLSFEGVVWSGHKGYASIDDIAIFDHDNC